MKKIFIALILISFLFACSKGEMNNIGSSDILISVNDFKPADGFFAELTRSSISMNQTGNTGQFSFKWEAGDTLGVFPKAGDLGQQMMFKTKDVGTDIGKTDFEGSTTGWILSETIKYASYYPYINDCLLKSSEIEFSYEGQTQSGNDLTGSMGHLGAYDFLYSDETATNINGKAGFNFKHAGAIILFRQKLAEDASYSKMTLTAEAPLFPSKIRLNLFGETVINTSELKSSFEVQLEDFSVTAGGFMNVWCMMPPVDLSGKKITVTMTNADPSKSPLIFDLAGKNFQSAYAYNLGDGNAVSADTHLDFIVDLGLPSGTRWSKYNLGADGELKEGNYYEWGGLTAKTSGFSPWTGGTVLDNEHDAAHKEWGGNWAIPTASQIRELIDNCIVYARFIPAKSATPIYIRFESKINQASVYLLPAGYYSSSTLSYKSNGSNSSNSRGLYWTKDKGVRLYWSITVNTNNYTYQDYVYSYLKCDDQTNAVNGNGAPIRPVNNANTDWSKLEQNN